MRLRKVSVAILTSTLVLVAVTAPVRAASFNGTLYYTRSSGTPNVDSVSFSYNDVTRSLMLGPQTAVATTPGADGIIFAPNGNLLVGGQATNNVFQVNPNTGTFTSAPVTTNSYHLALDPSGQSVWTSTFEGSLVNVPLNPFGSAPTVHTLSGGDTGITTLAFVPGGQDFYVNGNPNNGGNFGTINLSTFVTTRILSGVNGGHGMIYDPFSGDLILGGGGELVQINPNNPSVILSSFAISGANIDQISADGHGHVFAADANGNMIFVDYAASGLVGSPSFSTSVGGFANIDDLAPLSGLGSAVPEPASFIMATTSAVLGLGYWWSRSRNRATDTNTSTRTASAASRSRRD
jgi:hypothetical protein